MAVSASAVGAGDWAEHRDHGWLWHAGAIVVALAVMLPVAAIAWLAVADDEGIWRHLAATVLPVYVWTTVLLITGVGLGVLVLGTATGWLVATCAFPGRRWFEWALLLPLAVPSYIVAYVYTDMLEFAGPVQRALRAVAGWHSARDYWFPEIRSLGGAVAVLSLALYPYVYLLARAAFLQQSATAFQASRTLGHGPWRSFLQVALPMARPALVVGVSLALMETLNDFGTVDFFAVPTFTVGIFNVWLNMGSSAGAAQMSLVLLAIVVALVLAERRARQGRRFSDPRGTASPPVRFPLGRGRALAATVACLVPVVLGFVVPASVLAAYALGHYRTTLEQDYVTLLGHSLHISAQAAAVAVVIAVFLAYATRVRGGVVLAGATRIAAMGYAVPGAVLAVGVLTVLAGIDNRIDGIARSWFGFSTGLLLSGTLAALTIAYVVRFLALSHGAVEAGLSGISISMDSAARTLGLRPLKVLVRVHLPLLRGSLATAVILVFVDTMKELPMTLALRPFNYETLATFVYQYATDELLEDAALGALTIVVAGIVPVILLSRTLDLGRRATAAGS